MVKLDSFTRQYLETALWSSQGDGITDSHALSDFAPETIARALRDCARFQSDMAAHLTDENLLVAPDGDLAGRAGHDFWLTRNRHGAGFWDGDWKEPAATVLTEAAHRMGSVDLYVGDDGRIYA